MNGSVSAPSSATMNGVLCVIRPEMKWTSLDSRSSLATMIGALSCRAAAKRRLELRTPLERVGSLASLNLAEGLRQVVAFNLGEAGERRHLGFEAETRCPLAGGRDPSVGDGGFTVSTFCIHIAIDVAA